MANYEMYICLNKATYESQIPTALQSNLGWNNYTYNDDGSVDTTTAYRPTWKEAVFKGKLGAPRESLDKGLIIVKGAFSMLIGVKNSVNHFNGKIDDINVYTKVLTLAEIKRNYNAGKRSHR